METDRILKEKEANLLVAKDDVVADLEATIAELQKQLQATQQMQLAAKPGPEEGDSSLQQQR